MSLSKFIKMLIAAYLCENDDSIPIFAGQKNARTLSKKTRK